VNAALVAAGIFLSRILGLVRESLKARYLGATGSVAADAFNAAFSIPNLMQNLFGEGALSASFIPVYSKALATGDRVEADRLASAVGALLGLISAILVLLGVAFAPALVSLIFQGFEGEKRELTILFTRILFPGAALFVFFAWCLGILNSHRKFFLSYAAPVAWNLAMIVALLMYRDRGPADLAYKISWASVIGAALQFFVMLPAVLRAAPGLRLMLGRGNPMVRRVVRNFIPAFMGRGVVQISAFVDRFIASFIDGAVSLLAYTQTLTMLPISLFGMAVSAAELPEMSSATGTDAEVSARVRTRLNGGLRQIGFFIIPSAIGFLLLGDTIIAALFESGRFHARDTRFSWGILAAASLGLLATTLARLYSSAFYALHDTRTPVRIAIGRVLLAATLGYLLAIHGPRLLGIEPQWGAAALALASSIAGWVELGLLRRGLNTRVGATGLPVLHAMKLLLAALLAGAVAFGLKVLLPDLHRIIVAAVVLVTYGALYFAITTALHIPESASVLARLRRRRGATPDETP
jgi:putative peptidoglycan lipid II flippase